MRTLALLAAHWCKHWPAVRRFQLRLLLGLERLGAAPDRPRTVRSRPPAVRRLPAVGVWHHRGMNADQSAIWRDHSDAPDVPGLSVRTTYPTNEDGVEVMLERWAAGSSEPPHSHPGDDMTVVVEGKMVVQFFGRTSSR